jgi:uncharacterized protein (DUF433 family)
MGMTCVDIFHGRLAGASAERLRPRGELDRVMVMEQQGREIGTTPPRFSREHIAVLPGCCGGKPHIAGHRIKVQHIAIWHERMGLSPEEIIAEHPELTVADVHAALAYYWDHRAAIDADIQADAEFVAALRASAPPSLLRQRLTPEHGPHDPLSSR